MIQFNKTFFQFTKRLALVVVLITSVNTMWAGSSTWYEKVQVKTNQGTATGLVYISQSEETDVTYPNTTTSETTISSWGWWASAVTVYLYANENGVENAIWGGWYDSNNTLLGSGDANTSVLVTPTKEKDRNPAVGNFVYTAKWVKPQVTGDPVTISLGTITAKTDDITPQSASYSIEEYTKVEHFKVDPTTNNNFTITLDNVTEATADLTGTATISIDYTPTGIHGTKTGTSYLASTLYNGDYTESNSDVFKPIYFNITEDYTPDFEVVHNISTNAYSIGTTNVGGKLESTIKSSEVHTKNYAASAEKYTGTGQQQNRNMWKAYIEGEETGYEGLFTIIAGADSETPTIHFNADATKFSLNTGDSKTLTAELKIECTYYDESNPAVAVSMAEPKTVYLSATVTQIKEATLLYGTLDLPIDTYEFRSQQIGADAKTSIPIVALNIENLGIQTVSEGYFEAVLNGSNIEISIKKDASISCGEMSSTITIIGTSALDHTTPISAALTVNADMYLGQPTVTSAGGDRTITFQWDAVFGATKYNVYSSADATDPIASTTDNKYVETLGNSESKKYWFTAQNNEGCESKKFGPVTETAELSLITQKNANATGLKTGTEYTGTGFPWRAVRDIDVSAAFDATGAPIFDELHIFALSTGTTTSALETPCLKYIKDVAQNGYTKSGSDIIEKKTNITKNSIYKFDNITSNKKIYLTGYRPYATTGTKNDEGVMYFKGGNVTLDLYLDNCEIYAQEKQEDIIKINEASGEGVFAKGSGSVFIFQSTATNAFFPFNVKIHLRGSNILDAAAGTSTQIDKDDWKDTKVTHYCSPISVLPSSTSDMVSITIDDVWTSEGNVNGSLSLIESGNDTKTNTPFASIDLGLYNTTLSINGGQITLLNDAASYKTTTYTLKNQEGTMTIDVYGLGTTNNDNAINSTLNDVNKIELLDGSFNGETPAFHATILAVDGGTYNTTIKHIKEGVEQTNLYNSDNKKLKLFTISNPDKKYWDTMSNGIANLTSIFPTMVDDLFPKAGVNISNTLSSSGSYHYPLSMYYQGFVYGHESLTPKDNQIHLYLPELSCEDIHHAWQICAPNFYMDIAALGREYAIGGGENVINVCPDHPEHKYTTDYFLYMEADQFVEGAMGTTYFTPMNLGYGDIVIGAKNDKLYSSVSTQDTYTINKKVYMLMPIEAAKWTLFTPPFDVANVYVIESYPENQLIKDYGGKRGKIPTQYVTPARHAQASRIMDLYAMWYFEGKGLATMSDFFGDGTTDAKYGKFVMDWIDYEANTNYQQQAEGDYTPVIEKLIHFTGKDGNYPEGKNWLDANYYLYKSRGNWQLVNDQYIAEWDTVTTEANGTDAIMNKGQVYAIQFPYNSISGVHDPSTTWDYWTGKYLLIESTAGPHTINGSNFVTSALSVQNVASSTASLFGNSTFAEIAATLPNREGTNTTMWALEKKSATKEGERDIHEMVQQTNATATLAPTSGVLLANFQAPQGMIAKSINYTTGEITYEKVDDNNTGDIETGLPTIAGDLTLLVESTEQGLTITPIKEQHVMLFDADGKMIFSKHLSAEENVTLPTGVYVVRGEYEQVKAIKK